MAHRPTLAEFVDQELRLTEPLFAGLVDAVLKQWRIEPPSRLASDMDALRVLHLHRQDFVRHATQSMFEQTKRKGPPVQPAKPLRLELALVDDEDVTADIEIARVVERANVELEDPLRDLRTYTSALVGDVNTARDTNPLRPEVWVRALMAAARGVPIARSMQTAVLRAAAPALIQAIQEGYAAATARLQAQGVTPSSHRTVVNEGVTTELSDAMRVRRSLDRAEEDRGRAQGMPESVEELLLRLEQGLSARPVVDAASARGVSPSGSAASTGSGRHEQRTTKRLSDLYDAVLSDRRLPRESLPLLSRLYPAVLRQTLSEPSLIDDVTHPVWRFMDHLAFLVQTRAVGDVKSNINFAQGLIEQLVNQRAGTDARLFQSAADRLAVLERQRFARAVAAAGAYIATLGVNVRGAGPGCVPSVPQALDAGGIETQPAPLRRGADAAPADPFGAWRAGSWLTLFLRGLWRRGLILWRAPNPGPLLLLDANEARHWALRPAALERLAQAGLARTLSPRSLVHDAGGRIGRVSRDPGPTLFG